MAAGKNVSVYSTPTCPFCHQVKDYLKKKGIEFVDYNVASDTDARDAMVKKSGQLGVPVIDVDGDIVVGFKPGKLDELLS